MTDEPIQPLGAYVFTPARRRVPVTLVYAGMANGKHQWDSVEQFPHSMIWKVTVAFLPPDTEINLRISSRRVFGPTEAALER